MSHDDEGIPGEWLAGQQAFARLKMFADEGVNLVGSVRDDRQVVLSIGNSEDAVEAAGQMGFESAVGEFLAQRGDGSRQDVLSGELAGGNAQHSRRFVAVGQVSFELLEAADQIANHRQDQVALIGQFPTGSTALHQSRARADLRLEFLQLAMHGRLCDPQLVSGLILGGRLSPRQEGVQHLQRNLSRPPHAIPLGVMLADVSKAFFCIAVIAKSPIPDFLGETGLE